MLILISSVYAIQLRISPAKIEFNLSVGEEVCNEINIFSDYNGDIIGNAKWSKVYSKNIKNYLLNAEELKLKVEFSERIRIDNSEKTQVCLTAEEPGEYYGALLYNTEKSPAGVGIWIFVKVSGETGNRLIGKVIEDNFIYSNYEKILLSIPTIILFITFIVLFIYYKKKSSK